MTIAPEGTAPPTASSASADAPSAPLSPRGKRVRLALHPGWIVILACGAFLARTTIRSGLNTDVFWQLAAGRWMLAHHAVIRSDVFSYTIHGRPWLAEEWGFEVLLAWMVQHVGPVSYWLLSGGVSIAALLVSAARWHRQGAGRLWSGALAILVTASLFLGLAARPQDLSYLFFAVELLVLTVARQHRRLLVILPVLLVIWANVHGSFLAGLCVLGLEAALATLGALRERPSDPARDRARPSPAPVQLGAPLALRDAAGTFLLCALATLANPHGPHLLTYAFRVSVSSRLTHLIAEWQSPDFHDPVIAVAIVVPMLIAVLGLSTGRVRSNLFDLVLWLAFLVATLHSIRFVPYLGIAFGGLVAPWWPQSRETLQPTRLTWPASALVCLALVAGTHLPAGAPQRSGALAAPVAAATFLRAQTGRVFSTYTWNDYLISRQIPVFVDGRTDLYFGTGILTTYVRVSTLAQPPDPVLSRWHVRWVLWPDHSALSTYLARDPRWRLVRRFRVGELFELRATS